MEVDALAARLAHRPLAFVAREFFRPERDPYPLNVEKVVGRELAIGEHLLLVLVRQLGVRLPRQLLRGFLRRDANGASAGNVDERGRDFSPVAKLQRAFSQAASGDDGNS